jgi:DNA-binding Lrp family transcriptional regulator
VFVWHKRFKEVQVLLQDDEWKGCPSTSRTDKSVEVIEKCLAKDGTMSARMVADITGINREAVCEILVEDLGKMKGVCSFCSSFVNTGLKTSMRCNVC